MANINLFIDIGGNAMIAAVDSPRVIDPASLPFYYPDTPTLRVYLLNVPKSVNNLLLPDVVTTAGKSLLLEITDGKVDSDRTVYTQQGTWATDANNTYFFATLALATAGIKALCQASAPRSASAFLKVAFVENGLQTDVFTGTINIGIGVGSATVTVPAGQTALTVQAADQAYYKNNPDAGQPLYVKAGDGTKFLIAVVANGDGSYSLQASQVN